MKHFKQISDLHQALGFPPPNHPLISLVRCSKACNVPEIEFTSDFYVIGLKKMKSGVMLYGKTTYDHHLGSMSFVRPRQITGLRDIELEEDGFLIYFHEDFLNGHPLHDTIRKYGYFDYETNEALHLSPKEETVIWQLFDKIVAEDNDNPDEFSRTIMLGHIESILSYAQRFYKRQFIHRAEVSGRVVSRFNEILDEYRQSGNLLDNGLPTVRYLAEQLHVSSRYLSDLLKQETGKTAMDLIHIFLVSEAKNLLKGTNGSISDTAYALGFENLPYFSRLFKKEVGLTPNAYRKQHLN